MRGLGVHLQHAPEGGNGVPQAPLIAGQPTAVETGNQGPKPTTKVDKRPRAETNEEISEHDWAALHTGNRCLDNTTAGQSVVLYVP